MRGDSTAPDRPLVTFALFAFNQEQYIREAIEGAFAQTYEPLEIILSDDCSTDRTFEIMQEMAATYKGPHVLQVRSTLRNLGLAGHINEIIETAKGSIITWIGGDDIALPQRTAKLVGRLLETPNCAAVHSAVFEMDVSGRILGERVSKRIVAGIDIDRCVGEGVSIVTQSCAFHREAFDRFGPFDPTLKHEGIAMAFRCAALGKIEFLSEPLTKYRLGSGISTYQGNDLIRIKKTEPIKIVLWYMTAFEQMKHDYLTGFVQLNTIQKRNLFDNIEYYRKLLNINKGKSPIVSIVNILFHRGFDKRAFRALSRYYIPRGLYAAIKKLSAAA